MLPTPTPLPAPVGTPDLTLPTFDLWDLSDESIQVWNMFAGGGIGDGFKAMLILIVVVAAGFLIAYMFSRMQNRDDES